MLSGAQGAVFSSKHLLNISQRLGCCSITLVISQSTCLSLDQFQFSAIETVGQGNSTDSMSARKVMSPLLKSEEVNITPAGPVPCYFLKTHPLASATIYLQDISFLRPQHLHSRCVLTPLCLLLFSHLPQLHSTAAIATMPC